MPGPGTIQNEVVRPPRSFGRAYSRQPETGGILPRGRPRGLLRAILCSAREAIQNAPCRSLVRVAEDPRAARALLTLWNLHSKVKAPPDVERFVLLPGGGSAIALSVGYATSICLVRTRRETP
jgi:hypothetical protein